MKVDFKLFLTFVCLPAMLMMAALSLASPAGANTQALVVSCCSRGHLPAPESTVKIPSPTQTPHYLR